MSESELGGERSPSPILAMLGPPGRPGPDPPHPSETHVSGLTAVFHWPATAATEALVPELNVPPLFPGTAGLTAA